jgi:DNA-binding MarR family transcriptional regulator
MTRQERIVHATACSGNLFLLITLPELRRRGVTYLAFFALQRTIEVAPPGSGHSSAAYSENDLRRETGLPDYETSRACSTLAKKGLVTLSKDEDDRRIRVLRPTDEGRRVLGEILSAAGRRLWAGIPSSGRIRRVREATAHLAQANSILRGTFQLSFFDKDLVKDQRVRKRARKRAVRAPRTPAGTQAR